MLEPVQRLKGTLTYSYLPNGELSAVFGMCDNHLLVVAPGTLRMMPATSLGLVRQGWRKAYQRCHHVGLSTEQRGTTN